MPYYAYCLQLQWQSQLESFALHRSGHLFQQFIVDAYACIEQNCLNYLKYNQKKIRVDLYSGLQDVLFMINCPNLGSKLVIELYFHQVLLVVLAICNNYIKMQ